MLLTYVKNPDVNPDKLDWDIHFGLARESTQDEYGTAAYKTVELDDFLGGAAVQHREVQGSESAGFNKIFNGKIALLDGGVESGFNPPREVKRVAARLYSIKGLNGNLELRQVGLSRASMNSGDVYILDAPDGIFQWNGSESNKDERAKAAEFVRTLASNRSGAETHVLNEADAAKDMPFDDNHLFWSHGRCGKAAGRLRQVGRDQGGCRRGGRRRQIGPSLRADALPDLGRRAAAGVHREHARLGLVLEARERRQAERLEARERQRLRLRHRLRGVSLGGQKRRARRRCRRSRSPKSI